MSEEFLSNDRRVEKHDSTGIRTTDLPIDNQMHWSLGYHALFLLCCNRLLLATSFTSEWEQKRSLKNEGTREKVTWEVKECSRRKAQNGQAKHLHKRPTRLQEQLRSRAINEISPINLLISLQNIIFLLSHF